MVTDDCGSGGSGGGESSGSGHCGDRGSGYGSGGSGERGMNSEEYTFEDDEDMAYGQGKKVCVLYWESGHTSSRTRGEELS